jgi:hypothetical protein
MSEIVTPEAVALRLFEIIAKHEGKSNAGADRKWILDTYAECLRVVKNPVGSSDPDEPGGKPPARDVVSERLAEMNERRGEGNAHPSGPSES